MKPEPEPLIPQAPKAEPPKAEEPPKAAEAPKADPPKAEEPCQEVECVSCKAKYNPRSKTWTVPGKAEEPKKGKKTVWDLLGLR